MGMRRGHVYTNTHPAQFLVDSIGLLPKGRVLDIAMGAGRNAIYLANLGFRVEGVDISAEGIDKAGRLAEQSGVSISVQVADVEDNYRIPARAYDAIICFYYLHRPLIPSIKRGLKPGGVIVYETYIIDQAQWGEPKNPDHLLGHNELLDMFRDFRVLRYREGIIGEQKAIASIVAQKSD